MRKLFAVIVSIQLTVICQAQFANDESAAMEGFRYFVGSIITDLAEGNMTYTKDDIKSALDKLTELKKKEKKTTPYIKELAVLRAWAKIMQNGTEEEVLTPLESYCTETGVASNFSFGLYYAVKALYYNKYKNDEAACYNAFRMTRLYSISLFNLKYQARGGYPRTGALLMEDIVKKCLAYEDKKITTDYYNLLKRQSLKLPLNDYVTAYNITVDKAKKSLALPDNSFNYTNEETCVQKQLNESYMDQMDSAALILKAALLHYPYNEKLLKLKIDNDIACKRTKELQFQLNESMQFFDEEDVYLKTLYRLKVTGELDDVPPDTKPNYVDMEKYKDPRTKIVAPSCLQRNTETGKAQLNINHLLKFLNNSRINLHELPQQTLELTAMRTALSNLLSGYGDTANNFTANETPYRRFGLVLARNYWSALLYTSIQKKLVASPENTSASDYKALYSTMVENADSLFAQPADWLQTGYQEENKTLFTTENIGIDIIYICKDAIRRYPTEEKFKVSARNVLKKLAILKPETRSKIFGNGISELQELAGQ